MFREISEETGRRMNCRYRFLKTFAIEDATTAFFPFQEYRVKSNPLVIRLVETFSRIFKICTLYINRACAALHHATTETSVPVDFPLGHKTPFTTWVVRVNSSWNVLICGENELFFSCYFFQMAHSGGGHFSYLMFHFFF